MAKKKKKAAKSKFSLADVDHKLEQAQKWFKQNKQKEGFRYLTRARTMLDVVRGLPDDND